MIWDIIVRVGLALIAAGLVLSVAALFRVCYIIGYTRGLAFGIKTMKEEK